MLSILQWNMNGYFNNYIDLEILIKNHNPSVILLNETHLAHNVTPHFPKAYVGHFYNHPHITSNKQGIGILVKRNLPHLSSLPQSNIASLAIELQTSNKITIVCGYSPPNQSICATDFNNLIPSTTHPFIVAGDFNAWSPLWGSVSSNSKGRTIEDSILVSNVVILNDGAPTHFSTHSSFTHIDLTLCSASLSSRVSWICIDDLHGSDHFPILSKIQLSRPQTLFKPRIYFKTDRADWSKFESACETLSCSFPISSNINQETSNIQKIIRSSANQSIPLSTTKPIKPAPLWWNSDLSTLRTKKQNAWHDFKRSRTQSNLILYKKCNALFRRSAKKSKIRCFQKFTSSISSSSDSKRIWADIKKLTGFPSHSSITSLKSSQGNLLYPHDIALELAVHFSNASSDSNFPPEFSACKLSQLQSNRPIPSRLSSSSKQLDADLSLQELHFALLAVKGRTPGFDKISYPIIKHLPLSLLIRLLNHYNNIFSTGNYPILWKTSSVVPILKPGKPQCEVNSYRPISLLPCLGKLMEKIIATRLSWYVQANKLIHHNQVAFKKGHGTVDALLYLDHFVSEALSRRNHISLLSLDFAKAFDRIGIQVVLRQLDKWKVGPRIYNFIKSFLSSRKLSVLISNVRSPMFPLDNGTPQGSPLSVILFTIAFDELSTIFSHFPNISHQMYADDVLLFSKIPNLNVVMATFTDILSRISSWSLSSGVSISPNKTKLLHICKKQNCNIPTFTFNNTNITCTDSHKFLGIVLDSKYSFKHHCKYVRDKLFLKLNIVKYLSCKRSLINSELLVNVTKALLLSSINYGIEIYGQHAKNNIKLLASPYHTAVRRSLRAFPTSPIKNILAESGLPSLIDNVEDNIRKLYPKLALTSNALLQKCFHSAAVRVRTPKIASSISKCASFAKDNGLPLRLLSMRHGHHPPWVLKKSSFINDLSYMQKSNTTSAEYCAHFLEISSRFKSTSWQLIFTDGSKANYTSFAVVKENGEPISYGLLLPFCSIFTAEATAVLYAMQYSSKSKGKYIICTDSMSCFQAIKDYNNSNHIIGTIRNILISHPHNIKIMWVPGHSCINGNTIADNTAKDMSITPTITSNLLCKNDVYRLIKQHRQTKLVADWFHYSHHYSRINPNRTKPTYLSSLPSNYTTPYTRLRIGHSVITNAYLLQGRQPSLCPFCNTPVSILHLLAFCPGLDRQRQQNFDGHDALSLLINPSDSNISKIYKFLKDSDLLRRI